MEIKMPASLWKITKDNEGEITLIFKIPSSDAQRALSIPEMKELDLSVKWDA